MDDSILKELQDQIASLYLPDPATALRERPHKAIRTVDQYGPRGHAVRIVGADVDVPVPIYTSEALDSKGFTLQSVFASITVNEDSVFGQDRDDLYMFLTLEGSYSSAWCELGRSGFIPYAGPGTYPFGMVASDSSLATLIRFRVLARSQHDQGTRVLRVTIDGMLAAGYQF